MSGVKHTPGPMRPLTAIEVAAGAAKAWRQQYQHWSPNDRFADGTTKGEVDDRLNRCAHTPENIAEIINEGWAYPSCDCCNLRWNVVVEMTSEWGEESRKLCLPCIDAAASIARQFPDAQTIARARGEQDGGGS